MPKVLLINPSRSTAGYSFITPRWLFVVARATPVELVGEPTLVDEAIERFNPDSVGPGDIVGIGINTGNCRAGYRVLKEAKQKGATVIVGGVHPTIFPDEPIEMGADAVVTGNADLVWRKAVTDAVENRLQRCYTGGRVSGEAMLSARWDLLDSDKYIFPSVQTVAGCPENCSFCSVWVTDGRSPRRRLAEKIIDEVNELYDLGYRCVLFADDNFNPATIGRIARETSPAKRKELEQVREERLKFFEQYDRQVPRDIYGMTQMTSEITSDPEYLAAMHDKMRIRGALIGIESFSETGLKDVGKLWNPVGKKMVETVHKIQENGIWVLGSIICGLESDTVETIRNMRTFAAESGAVAAQFTYYAPYPGTKDFHEMVKDMKNRETPGYVPKHKTRLTVERHWLKPINSVDIIAHAHITRDELLVENKKCWDTYYSLRQTLYRARHGEVRKWPLAGKLTYIFSCFAFKRIYSGHGVSADSVRARKAGFMTRLMIKSALGVHRRFFRRKKSARAEAVPASA